MKTFEYRGALVEVDGGPISGWIATIRFQSQEVDTLAATYDDVVGAAKRWIDAAPELARE